MKGNGTMGTTEAELNARVEANLQLVKHVVFQVAVHFPRHVDREELVRAGALGLVEAARRYDESRGVPFERFPAQRIRGATSDSVRAADCAPRSAPLLAHRDPAPSALSPLGRTHASRRFRAAFLRAAALVRRCAARCQASAPTPD